LSPDPTTVHPLSAHDRVAFLKPLVSSSWANTRTTTIPTMRPTSSTAWWDRPADPVTEHARTIMAGTPAGIERSAVRHRREEDR